MSILRQSWNGPKRQAGISLFVVLILLVVMSVLGVAVLRSAAMQERMSANMYDRNLAMQAAEAALVAGREWLASHPEWQTKEPVPADCKDAAKRVCPSFTELKAVTWWTGPELGGGSTGMPKTTTEYWIEYLGENLAYMENAGVVPASETTSKGPLYRITARSQAEGRASVTLQTDVLYRIQRL